jgi:ribokinase
MMSKKIVIVGSTNMDMVVTSMHIPVPGETVLADSFFMNPGGKGANQAVAVSRLGGTISFITKVGNDIFGKQFIQLFNEESINTQFILEDTELPSGVALITVDKLGENSIVVAPGANSKLLPDDLQASLKEIATADLVLMQLEIPIETVNYVAEYAAGRNIRVILDPAPAMELKSELLKRIDIVTPNQTEAEILSGIKVTDIESAGHAAKRIHELGVKNVVITMGALGALVYQEGESCFVPSEKVNPIDSTAAGDVFNAGLAVALSEGKSLKKSVEFASVAAAISVTRMGAQSSIPYRSEMIATKILNNGIIS